MAKSKRTPSNKGKRFPAEVLTADEVLALLSKCSSRAPTGQRNAALIVLMWRAGLRCSEALDLHAKDLDSEAHTVRILNGKGRRARTVGLDATSFAVIARWMDTRKAQGINGRNTLLCTLRGRKLSTAYVRALLPRLAAKAGIDRRVHPHALRHTHAVELLREGVPIPTISRQLGHSSIAVTAAYLDHLEPADVIEAIQSRVWPPAAAAQ